MKNRSSVLILLAATWFLGTATPGIAQERKMILPENVPWSYVFVKPTVKNWTTQYPLPKSGICIGKTDTDKNWPKNQPYVWATTRVTLPEDYKAGNLFLRYAHDDHMVVYLNGTVIYRALGATWDKYRGLHKITKRIPDILRPGENIIAVTGVNLKGFGEVHASLWTDGHSLLDIKPLLPVDGVWSYTSQNPGERWTGQYPLPRGKSGVGIYSTNDGGLWDLKEKNIWMTQIVTLPADYVPEEMIVQYRCDDNFWLYVNGTEVLHRSLRNEWQLVRDVKNTLKPGRNIIAVRGENTADGGFIGIDIFTRKYTDEEKKNPLEHMNRPAPPADVLAEMVAGEKEMSEADKKIALAMNCFKIGQDVLAISSLEKVAAEDEKDFQANCILGIYALTKDYDRVKAFAYFQKCVKVDAKNPAVLNNYGVAAMENKKINTAIQAWERLAKIDATLPALGQNVGCLMDLMNKKQVTLQEAEQLRLVELYITVCTNQNRDRDQNRGFMLMPLSEGVGNRPDCDSAFVHEYKRGRVTVTCQPYEVRKTYYAK